MCAPIIGAVASLAGAVVSGIGQMQAMQAQNASLEYNARLQERQAAMERDRSAFEGQRFQTRYRRTLGQQIAAMSQSGIDPGAGTALSLIESDAEEADLDLGAIRYGGAVAASNAKAKAAGLRSQKASGFAMGAAFLSPVLSGAARVGSTFA